MFESYYGMKALRIGKLVIASGLNKDKTWNGYYENKRPYKKFFNNPFFSFKPEKYGLFEDKKIHMIIMGIIIIYG